MQIKLLLSATLIFAAFSAHAGNIKMKVSGTIVEKEIFERKSSEGFYENVGRNTKIVNKTEQEIDIPEEVRVAAQVPTEKPTKVKTHVTEPLKPEEGYLKANLVKESDGSIYLVTEYKLLGQQEKGLAEISSDLKVQMEITQGTWEDYLAGKDVKLAATPTGRLTYLDNQKKLMEQILMRDQSSSMASTMSRIVTLESVKVTKFDFAHKKEGRFTGIKVFAHGNQLEVAYSKAKFKYQSVLNSLMLSNLASLANLIITDEDSEGSEGGDHTNTDEALEAGMNTMVSDFKDYQKVARELKEKYSIQSPAIDEALNYDIEKKLDEADETVRQDLINVVEEMKKVCAQFEEKCSEVLKEKEKEENKN